jgi:hypothetical protein
MTNVIILTLQSSTFLFYVVTYHFRLLYLISTKGARRVWPVSRWCLLLLGTWSYLRICRRSVLPYTRFCNCLWDYNYVSHINFAIFYYTYYENKTLRQQTAINFVTPREREKWKDGETIQSHQELENNSHLSWYTDISNTYRDSIVHITLYLFSTLHRVLNSYTHINKNNEENHYYNVYTWKFNYSFPHLSINKIW